MTANSRGSVEKEQGNGNESMTLVDLENVEDGGENCESGFVSPAELTRINFRSLIGHTDEVGMEFDMQILISEAPLRGGTLPVPYPIFNFM